MIDRFLHTLTGPCGVNQGDRVLVCCSGGIDSMVLLRLMKQAQAKLALELHVVTVDHGLRCEAPGDAQFVLAMCRDEGVDASLYTLNMDPHQPNLEEAARLRRYTAIESCRAVQGARWVATGHTMDDQAETLIYRLIRGSGMRGAQGMAYVREDGLIRPMLDITRAEVEAYAREQGVRYVTDQTNADLTLARNHIRKKILPLMQALNPEAVQALHRFAGIAREENAVLDAQAQTLRAAALITDWRICRVFDPASLQAAPAAVFKRLAIAVAADMLGEPRGIAAQDVDGIQAVLHGSVRAYTLKRRVRVECTGDTLVFTSAGEGPFYEIPVAGPGTYRVEAIGQNVCIKGTPQNALIRSFLPGDRIDGDKVVKRLADQQVIEPLRRFWPVLISEGRILGVGGMVDPQANVHMEFPL